MHQTKKRIILSYSESRGLKTAGPQEFRAIQQELLRLRGEKGRTSFAYIARVLNESGVQVQYKNLSIEQSIPEPYAGRLKGLLRFHDLEEAEASLRDLDAAYREYQEAQDRRGMERVRDVLLRGRRRAESLAANPKLSAEKHAEKREIARWFGVWLQTPDVFFSWLELRKRAEEFRRHFAQQSSEFRKR